MTSRAALYLRSSKDRSDVSIDAQRRALHDLAGVRNLVVTAEFADAVESGKDDDRPGFQRLLSALKAPDRDWQTILVLDTSRVARRRALAMIFEQECKRRGVAIVFKNIPDTDPITEMLLKSILQAMDEWHSLTARAKGLAGMAENVRQGWRAGGRAPRGYDLATHTTGAIREGTPVTKTKLIPNAEAPVVAQYLRARAAGELRGVILTRLGVDWTASSLNGMEWQALTYAGHTVWNMHAEREGTSSTTGEKRRPRSDWVIRRGTHDPLITDEEAEALLAQLEQQRQRKTRRDATGYLLTGLLVTPSGESWHGDRGAYYRHGKGRKVLARRVDGAVLDRVFTDLEAPETAARVLNLVRESVSAPVDRRTIAGLERRVAALTQQIGRTVDLAAAAETPDPFLRRVTDLEHQRAEIVDRLASLRAQADTADTAAEITIGDVQGLLRTVRAELEASDEPAAVKPVLAGLVERIELDPVSLACSVHYRIESGRIGGEIVASRGGSDMSPLSKPARWEAPVALPAVRRAA